MKKRNNGNLAINMECLTTNTLDLASDAIGEAADHIAAIRENKGTVVAGVIAVGAGLKAVNEGNLFAAGVAAIAGAFTIQGAKSYKISKAAAEAERLEMARLYELEMEKAEELANCSNEEETEEQSEVTQA